MFSFFFSLFFSPPFLIFLGLPGVEHIQTEEHHRRKLDNEQYERILRDLQRELVKMQAWVQAKGLKVVVLFEGRDAAGKGGAIKRAQEEAVCVP